MYGPKGICEAMFLDLFKIDGITNEKPHKDISWIQNPHKLGFKNHINIVGLPSSWGYPIIPCHIKGLAWSS